MPTNLVYLSIMGRSFKQRASAMGLLILVFLAIYGIAKSRSYDIIAYVVEHALLQKAPSNMDATSVKDRFDRTMAKLQDKDKLLKLLSLSSYLEKVQKLTPAELDALLPRDGSAPKEGF